MKNIKPISFTLPKAQYRATGLPLCLLWVFFMEEKRCTRCKRIKLLSEFYVRSNAKDKLQSECKECVLINSRSKHGLATRIFHNQINTSKRRHCNLPNYTKTELEQWLLSKPLFHKLYDNWVESGYNKHLSPSIDRKDDYKPYIFGNIQLMTWDENRKKYYSDSKIGLNNKMAKAVLQYDKNGKFIKEYYSIMQASRENDMSCSQIADVCRKEKYRKTAGGYTWKYKNPNNVNI